MKQEDKDLLLKDLCARLQDEVVVDMHNQFDMIPSAIDVVGGEVWDYMHENGYPLEQFDIKPYLRPMFSMTEEEEDEYETKIRGSISAHIDWLNAHHFDYRGLIEKGLALEAQDGMYNIK